MRMRSLFRWHLGASLLFLFGTLTPVIIYAYFYFYKEEKETRILYMVTEAVSWTLMAAHVLPEFVVDLNTFPGRSRKFSHFRYGPTPCPNMVQSLVFAAACFFQGVFYYSIWSDGEVGADEEEKISLLVLNAIAAHLWLVSGILAVRSIGFRCFCCGTSHVVSGGLEQSMNDFFVFSTVLLWISSYMFFFEELEIGAYALHILVRCVWALLALFYVGMDIVEIATNRRHSSSAPATPLTRRTNDIV
uniref:Uncharacterized protein n=1 Tax=Amphora coffeiformis TaxID=265554 RepID=A0A7S3L5A1_9STRA|mmetsp:Transcript_18675/g.35499  ORF Transcript_18675/g.35499 Transcript_18675/m.35499 type:complete len:246 (+) Transcript_18675:100-837(+)